MAAAVVCLMTAGRAGAGYDEGMDAFAQGDYETAYKELRPLAEKGEPGAQFTLGFMYDYGQGVPQNTQEAIWWYRNAAEQGIAVAQFSLGEIYEGGRGTPQDLAEAYRWYSLAVKNLSPGEIRDSVVERREAVAGKLSPQQLAVVTALMNGARGEKATREARATVTAPEADDAALVAAIQGELTRLGYELDWQAGSLDRLTRGAIQAFEIESGREITGRPSEALLAAMRATERPGSARTTPGATPGATSGAATAAAAGEPAAQSEPAPSDEPVRTEAAADDTGTAVAVLDEPAQPADEPPADELPAGEQTADVPSGAAGGPLIPLDDEADAAQQEEAQAGTMQPGKIEVAARTESARQTEAPASGSHGAGWDLQFIERQIKRLDAITERVDGPSAAVPGWDALESWEIETRGLLAARLGQDAADGLSARQQAPVVGDPYGNFHHTSAAFRAYLSGLLKRL